MTQVMCIVNCMVYNETAYTIANAIKDANPELSTEEMRHIGLDETNWQPTFEDLDPETTVYCPDANWSLT